MWKDFRRDENTIDSMILKVLKVDLIKCPRKLRNQNATPTPQNMNFYKEIFENLSA